MVLRFTDQRTVDITMEGFIGDLLTGVDDIAWIAKTPAAHTLFRVRDDVEKLGDSQRERFYSNSNTVSWLRFCT
jgi:hypothetical protein